MEAIDQQYSVQVGKSTKVTMSEEHTTTCQVVKQHKFVPVVNSFWPTEPIYGFLSPELLEAQ